MANLMVRTTHSASMTTSFVVDAVIAVPEHYLSHHFLELVEMTIFSLMPLTYVTVDNLLSTSTSKLPLFLTIHAAIVGVVANNDDNDNNNNYYCFAAATAASLNELRLLLLLLLAPRQMTVPFLQL